AVLPRRVPGYQPRWLDEAIASGSWTWVCSSQADGGAGNLSILGREDLASLAAPHQGELPALTQAAERVLESLRRRGAVFITDLAADTGLPPSGVRSALWSLLRRQLVTNDRLDVVRKGEETPREEPARNGPGRAFRTMRASFRRGPLARPEGRWSLVPWGHPEQEAQVLFQATLLLHRYGVAARELALLDPWMPPWRVLYEVLSRLELAGDVRRGYFVEGLSGAQFALPEAARKLQDLALPSTAAAPVFAVASLDPANL